MKKRPAAPHEKHWLKRGIKTYSLNILPLVYFELLYYIVGILVIYPANKWAINSVLALTHLNFVDGANLSHVFTNPMILVAAMVILLINAFYIVFEFTSLLLCFHESRIGHRVQTLSLIKEGFIRALDVFLPKNALMTIFVVLIMPYIGFGISSSISEQLTVPSFIMDYIWDNPALSLAFCALVAGLFLLVVRLIFSFHYFTLEDDSFFTSAKKSHQLLRGHFFKTLGYCILCQAFLVGIAFFIGLIMVVLLLVLRAFNVFTLLYQFSQTPTLGISILLAIVAVIGTFITCLLDILYTPMILGVLTACYYEYSWEEDRPVVTKPLVPDSSSINWSLAKRTILIALILLLAVSGKYLAITQSFSPDTYDTIKNGTLVAAHRGDSANAPENTRAAINSAIATGADYVEIDVCETRDGVIVVSHDNNLSRLAGVDVDIWNTDYADLKDLDIGSHFSPDFSDERIMTLEEAMDLCDGKIKMNIELKPTVHDQDFVEKAVAIFQKHNFYNQGFFASLDGNALEKVEAIDPKIRTCLNTFIALGQLEDVNVDIYSVEATFANQTLLNRIHAANKSLWVWTVDEDYMVDDMLELGVDAIITDHPDMGVAEVANYAPTQEEIFLDTLVRVFGTL